MVHLTASAFAAIIQSRRNAKFGRRNWRFERMKTLACLLFVCGVVVCCSCNLEPLSSGLDVLSDRVAAWEQAINDALVVAAQK